MIEAKDIEAIASFLSVLQDPAVDIKLSTGETVSDPEKFIETQVSILRQRKDTPYGEVVYARLNKWKAACLASTDSH